MVGRRMLLVIDERTGDPFWEPLPKFELWMLDEIQFVEMAG